MAQKFLTSIDLGTNELIRPQIHNLTTAQQPAAIDSVTGQLYFNTTDKLFRVFNGTGWINAGVLYSTSVVDSSGIRLRLTGSDNTNDDVIFAGTNLTVSRTDASTINFALPQSIATTANPTFAGATLDLVTIGVGVSSGNLITTTSGKLDINAAGGGGVFVLTDLTVSGNLVINGTTTTVNSSITTLDDPILTLGGDTSTVETVKDRGVEAKWSGEPITVTQYGSSGAATDIQATVASTTGYSAGDIITISGATGTEQIKLNGTWRIKSISSATVFTFDVATAITTGAYTTNIGVCIKSKNAFFGLDQSTGNFTFIPQANNQGEVFSGTPGTIVAGSFSGSGSALTSLNASNLSTGTVAVARGGTGITSYAVGDLIYASATGTLSKLADIAANNVLLSGGVGAAPFYGKVGLTTHISGTLAVGNGGTGTATAPTQGGVAYGASTSAYATTAAGTSGYLLRSNGTSAPSWTPNDLTSFPNSNFKKSVKVATTANITLSGTQTIDGIAVVAGDRVLVRQQSAEAQNGIYIVASGAWTRSTAADGSSEIDSAIVVVDQGTTYGGQIFTNTFKTTDVVGTTAMPWYQIPYTGTATFWGMNVLQAQVAQGLSPGYVLPIANGGTGADTAPGARTNLGINSYVNSAFGDGTLKTFALNHGLATTSVIVQVWDTASGATVFCDVTRTNNSTVTLDFNTAPTFGQYTCAIMKVQGATG